MGHEVPTWQLWQPQLWSSGLVSQHYFPYYILFHSPLYLNHSNVLHGEKCDAFLVSEQYRVHACIPKLKFYD